MEHASFVEEAIGDLIARDLVVVCKEMPYVVNPLTVSVQSNGKKRLILDLRHVNHHLWKTSVKFEDIRLYAAVWRIWDHGGTSLEAFKREIAELPGALVGYVSLLPQLLAESKASSTTKGYYQGFVRWKDWALKKGLSEVECFPARAIHVALYLACLVQHNATSSPVIQAYYSLKWAHSIIGRDSPTDSLLVRNILEGAKRRLSTPRNRKDPITPELLESMYSANYSDKDLFSQRTICGCLIAYAGFLRVSELLSIRMCDIEFSESHMTISIRQSKTDIYRDGDHVVKARTYTKLCPVSNLERYIDIAELILGSDRYVFRSITKTSNGFILRDENKPLSYTRMRELFIQVFSPFVSDISKYGLHSLRSGGATSAANLTVADRIFKRHGRWKSENAKDCYVKDSLEERLLVSRNLGIRQYAGWSPRLQFIQVFVCFLALGTNRDCRRNVISFV
ncbi:uncharacterized protein LOC117330050 [Pecten maximus]|uniref:uncharacterized protein LOC117330050 n=1 Tax=Pecten maximus TaxID=6579 RepID=UPI001458ED7B|nr:uncharacterized protein LOC117330050 [Pecten maximus]